MLSECTPGTCQSQLVIGVNRQKQHMLLGTKSFVRLRAIRPARKLWRVLRRAWYAARPAASAGGRNVFAVRSEIVSARSEFSVRSSCTQSP
eukprot:4601472-Prymnesium_polylepis.1